MLRNSLLTASHRFHFIFFSFIEEFQRHLGIFYLCRSQSYIAMIHSSSFWNPFSIAHNHSQIGILALLINYRFLFSVKKHHKKQESHFSTSLCASVGAIKIKYSFIEQHILPSFDFLKLDCIVCKKQRKFWEYWWVRSKASYSWIGVDRQSLW